MGDRYPDHIPLPLAEVLGQPPYMLYQIAMALKEIGVDVPSKYEGETGTALHFLIPFAIEHGDDWQKAAADELLALKDGKPFEPPALEAVGHDVVKALGAAVMALRSFQYGNAAEDLAKSIADSGEEALRKIGFPPGFIAMSESRSS